MEEFNFCGEITFPMLRSEFALAHAMLVMTKQSHCEYTTCNAFEAVSYKH